jgi:hypothetical protein
MSWADLAYRGLVVRPWDVPKPKCAYRHSPFRSTLSTTLNLLAREIRMLNGKQIVVMLDIRERDIRLDGLPRADARIGEPCVALSFESNWGPVRKVTGEYRTWQDNLRAISLSLEALRSVDRYGVSKSGEQYRGWRALPVSTDGAALLTTSDEAVDFLSQWFVDGNDDLDAALRKAMMETHPDHGGDSDEFRKVLKCRDLLRAAAVL